LLTVLFVVKSHQPPVSKEIIPKSLDKAMDKDNPSSNGHLEPGISIRNGPMEVVDTEMPDANGVETNGMGAGKRKSRGSLGNKVSYAESESSEEDDQPLVRSRTP
jgi:DNA topoisomerase I